MLYAKLHFMKSWSRFVVPTSSLQSKPGRWQLCLLQGQGEALTGSLGWAGLGFASEVRGSGVMPHEVWPPSFL